MLYNNLYIGQKVTKANKITAEAVDSFAAVTEDFNPLHMDDSMVWV